MIETLLSLSTVTINFERAKDFSCNTSASSDHLLSMPLSKQQCTNPGITNLNPDPNLHTLNPNPSRSRFNPTKLYTSNRNWSSLNQNPDPGVELHM